MNPADPHGQDDVLVANPELHLPLGEPVKLLLRSKDVLHNFSVAQFRVKMDLVPGLVTYIWFTPTRAGQFDLLCEELCGVAHFAMRGRMVVEQPAAFQTWLERQPTFAQNQGRAPGNAVAGQARYAVCAACHGAQGEGNIALNAPKLSGQGAWYLERQLKQYKQGARGTHEKDTFGKMMAPMAATLADDAAIADVAAYIGRCRTRRRRPRSRAIATSAGQRFATCAACHGADGRGIAATNAPRLKGMSDWYLATAAEEFQERRSRRPSAGLYGAADGADRRMLADDAAISDVLPTSTR